MSREIIEAYAAVARAILPALLILVGEFADAGEARRKVRELGLQHRVRFVGYQPGEVMAGLAATADIGICLRHPTAERRGVWDLDEAVKPGRAYDRFR